MRRHMRLGSFSGDELKGCCVALGAAAHERLLYKPGHMERQQYAELESCIGHCAGGDNNQMLLASVAEHTTCSTCTSTGNMPTQHHAPNQCWRCGPPPALSHLMPKRRTSSPSCASALSLPSKKGTAPAMLTCSAMRLSLVRNTRPWAPARAASRSASLREQPPPRNSASMPRHLRQPASR